MVASTVGQRPSYDEAYRAWERQRFALVQTTEAAFVERLLSPSMPNAVIEDPQSPTEIGTRDFREYERRQGSVRGLIEVLLYTDMQTGALQAPSLDLILGIYTACYADPRFGTNTLGERSMQAVQEFLSDVKESQRPEDWNDVWTTAKLQENPGDVLGAIVAWQGNTILREYPDFPLTLIPELAA